MTDVSIILPTYNRADVILRAVHSVLTQTHADWELIVVDDGSTDHTLSLLEGLDSRIRILRQPNQGVYVARNAGLAASTGQHITFMDSDDEWLPHFLSLTLGYLQCHPQARWVATEFWEDAGDGSPLLRHDRDDIARIYAPFARHLGMRALELPPGESDDYLRVYQQRTALGDWAHGLVKPEHPLLDDIAWAEVPVYRGEIFDAMRWGYLHWLPVTVLTREALNTIGPFVTGTRSAADYRFLCLLARHYPAHMIALPSAIKYDKAAGSQRLAQDHLATGAGAYRFAINKLAYFDELYWQARPQDPDIDRLRRHFCFDAGLQALLLGQRADALLLLRQAACWKPRLWPAGVWLALVRLSPNMALSAFIYRGASRLARMGRQLQETLVEGIARLRRPAGTKAGAAAQAAS